MTEEINNVGLEGIVEGIVEELPLERFPIGERFSIRIRNSEKGIKEKIVAKRINEEYVKIVKSDSTEEKLKKGRVHRGGIWELASYARKLYQERYEKVALTISPY